MGIMFIPALEKIGKGVQGPFIDCSNAISRGDEVVIVMVGDKNWRRVRREAETRGWGDGIQTSPCRRCMYRPGGRQQLPTVL